MFMQLNTDGLNTTLQQLQFSKEFAQMYLNGEVSIWSSIMKCTQSSCHVEARRECYCVHVESLIRINMAEE